VGHRLRGNEHANHSLLSYRCLLSSLLRFFACAAARITALLPLEMSRDARGRRQKSSSSSPLFRENERKRSIARAINVSSRFQTRASERIFNLPLSLFSFYRPLRRSENKFTMIIARIYLVRNKSTKSLGKSDARSRDADGLIISGAGRRALHR